MKIESRPSGKDIEAWQLARELARKVYVLTKKAKFSRDFGLKGQSRSNPFSMGLSLVVRPVRG